MAGPIQDLRRQFPKAEIDVFCGSSNAGIVKLIPGIDTVHRLPLENLKATFQAIRKTPKADVLLDFGPWPRLNALFSACFRARYKLGFRSLNQHRHYLYEVEVAHSDKVHEIENHRALLKPLGVNPVSKPILQISDLEKPVLAEKRYLLFHTCASGILKPLKEWPEENWLALADYVNNCGLSTYITGAGADQEAAERLEKASGGKIKSLAGKYSLTETSRILYHSMGLVTVNTGIMHIAAALKVPLVAMHGPASVERWGPISDNAINLFSQEPGCGYVHFGFEKSPVPTDCMRKISVEMAIAAVSQLLDRQ